MKLEASKVLYGAADLLDETGWCRFNMTDKKGRHCAWGAVVQKLPQPVNDFGLSVLSLVVRNALLDVIQDNKNWTGITRWNDSVARDKRTVQRAMRKAAKNLATR